MTATFPRIHVTDIPEDGRVAEPGAYRIPIERYHEQCAVLPSLSSSGIRKLIQQSPAAFWKDSSLNPNHAEPKSKPALDLGKAAHTLLLGEDGFNEVFVVQPEKASDGTVWNNNKTICKDWNAAQASAGRTILTQDNIEQIRGMAGLLPWQAGMQNCGLLNTPIVKAGLLAGTIELSLFFPYEGLFLRSRPDVIPNASGDYVDLKTISPRGEDGLSYSALQREVFTRGYFIQGALVGMAVRNALGLEMKTFNLVFVDTGNVHDVAVYQLEDEDLIRGERAVFAAVDIFKRCRETGIWPGKAGRSADARILPLPSWGRESFDRTMDIIEQEYAA